MQKVTIADNAINEKNVKMQRMRKVQREQRMYSNEGMQRMEDMLKKTENA